MSANPVRVERRNHVDAETTKAPSGVILKDEVNAVQCG